LRSTVTYDVLSVKIRPTVSQ